jgi:CubicO group peptidase (beta-lactamase class C family)
MSGSTQFERFDKFIVTSLRETRLPSIVAGIIEDGKLVHQVAHGYRDIASQSPPTIHTLYGVGSVTKSFTALSVAKLVEAGKIGFHDNITDYLPLKQKAFQEVEIHHLLTHTTGIPGLGFAEALIFRALGQCTHPLPVLPERDLASFLDEVDNWPGETRREIVLFK